MPAFVGFPANFPKTLTYFQVVATQPAAKRFLFADAAPADLSLGAMPDVKDTNRAHVRIGYDGTVQKTFRGHEADKRFANECRILRHLEARGCDFVPRLLDSDPAKLRIVTSNCGQRVDHISDERLKSLFAELEQYGVRHDDPYMRNVTYRIADGRFCLIDFELATLLDEIPPPPRPDAS